MRKIKFDELNISSALSIIFQMSFKKRLINGTQLKEKHLSASNANSQCRRKWDWRRKKANCKADAVPFLFVSKEVNDLSVLGCVLPSFVTSLHPLVNHKFSREDVVFSVMLRTSIYCIVQIIINSYKRCKDT